MQISCKDSEILIASIDGLVRIVDARSNKTEVEMRPAKCPLWCTSVAFNADFRLSGPMMESRFT